MINWLSPQQPILAQHQDELQRQEDSDRLARFRRAWLYYYGTPGESPLAPIPSDPSGRDNTILNYARVLVDKGVSFLFGQDVVFSLDEQSDQRSPAEQWLDDCWRFNRKASTLHKLALNGAVCGHSFLKIMLPRPGEPYPRLVVLDPAIVTVRWDSDDITAVLRYIIQYPAVDPRTGRSITKRQRIVRDDALSTVWTVEDAHTQPDSSLWVIDSTETWPYPWPPIADCQNLPAPNEYWGISDLEADVLSLSYALNMVASTRVRTHRLRGHPLLWGRGMGGQLPEMKADSILMLPAADSELGLLEMQEDASGKVTFDDLKAALHDIARVPEIAYGRVDGGGNASGAALAVRYQPLLEKTRTKQVLYGDMVAEVCRRLLEMGGRGADQAPALQWPPLLPKDAYQEAQALQLHAAMGLASKETLSEQAGYDWQVEKERIQQEQDEAARQLESSPDVQAMLQGMRRPGLPAPDRDGERERAR